jgi:hypothetical protein
LFNSLKLLVREHLVLVTIAAEILEVFTHTRSLAGAEFTQASLTRHGTGCFACAIALPNGLLPSAAGRSGS